MSKPVPDAGIEIRHDQSEFRVIQVHSRLDDYGLPPSAFRVYCHLARRAGGREAWPAIASIARICRMNPRTVRESLRLLVKHRLVVRKDRSGRTALYWLTAASSWRPPKHINDDPCQNDTPVSKVHGSPPKAIQGHPSQKNADEVYPSKVVQEVNPTAVLLATWCESFEEHFGNKAHLSPQDKAAAKQFLQDGSTPQEVLDVAKQAWEHDGFYSKKSVSLGFLLRNFNQVQKEVGVLKKKSAEHTGDNGQW